MKVIPLQAYAGSEKQRYRYNPFATPALERVDDQLHATIVLPQGKTFYTLIEAVWASGSVWTVTDNLLGPYSCQSVHFICSQVNNARGLLVAALRFL